MHAPDATPEETLTPRGSERALFSGHDPAGWKRVLGQGTALGPWSSDAGGSGDGGSGNSDGGGF